MENVAVFYGRLEYLRTFRILYGHLLHFVLILYILVSYAKKNLATLVLTSERLRLCRLSAAFGSFVRPEFVGGEDV
jgi:hypothetical protein